MKTTSKDKYLTSALRACDWFVNNQVQQQSPNWDANHGRIPYHVHIKSGYQTLGLCWSMSRATMVLLSGYKATKNKDYLETARRALNYNKALQVMDQRDKDFGAFKEETPISEFCYPRDGIETAQGFFQWYRITKDKDALERGCFFLDWYLKHAFKKAGKLSKWAIPEIRFDRKKPRLSGFHAYQSGAGRVFYSAYLLTKKKEYKEACISYGYSSCDHFMKNIDPKKNSFLGHNDDGLAISVLSAYKLTKDKKLLSECKRMADYYKDNGYSYDSFSGLPCVLNTMIEIDKLEGGSHYAATIEKLAKQTLKNQIKTGKKNVKGGFIGEDEPATDYVKGSKGADFVVTRPTVYAALAFFKLSGRKGLGYTLEY